MGVVHVMVFVWNSEDKLRELALPFHCVGPRSLIRLSCFGGKPLTHFTFLSLFLFIYCSVFFFWREIILKAGHIN